MSTKIEKLKEQLPESARKNPIPYAITGLGLACTLGQVVKSALRKPPPPPTFRERCTSAAESAKESVAQVAEAAKEKVHSAAEAVSEKADEVKQKIADVRSGAEQAGAQTEARALRFITERPFLVGAGVVATGFLAGLLLPPSRTEKEWLGATGRQFIDDAKAAGREVVEEGKALAKEAVAAADEAVRDASADTGEAIRDKLASV